MLQMDLNNSEKSCNSLVKVMADYSSGTIVSAILQTKPNLGEIFMQHEMSGKLAAARIFLLRGDNDIFSSQCEAIINPVNCVGVMGKGLALAFKNKYPEVFSSYKSACDKKTFVIGTCQSVSAQDGKVVINFPTKDDFKNPSKYSYIELGLESLNRHILKRKIKSIAIPALGCGNGGLKWNHVLDIMIRHFTEHATELGLERVEIYQPIPNYY